MLKVTKTAYDELLAQVKEKGLSTFELRNDGWLTTEQWGKEWGKSTNCASVLIRKLVRGELWEYKKFVIKNNLRGNFPVNHYRPIKNGKTSKVRKSR